MKTRKRWTVKKSFVVFHILYTGGNCYGIDSGYTRGIEFQSNRVRNLRSQHDDTMARLRSLVLALNETWKGEAQDAFVAKFESMQSNFTSFSEMLEGYATLMDTAANQLRETDMSLKGTMQNSFN